MPSWANTVIPLEQAHWDSSTQTIRWATHGVHRGQHHRLAGEDLKQGHLCLPCGTVLRAAALGLLASLGIAQISVRPRLKVAYLSTGDEILTLSEPQRMGAIYDSNRYTITTMLARMGIDVIDGGVIPDQPAALQEALTKATQQADAIITTAGVSVGEADHVKAVVRSLGQVDFWRIAMRPGRPMGAGRLGDALWFGLPGNPVASMVTFLALVKPTLEAMQGAIPTPPLMIPVISQEPIRKKRGRTEFQRVHLTPNDQGQLMAKLTGQQGSGVLRSMVQANALMVLPPEQGDVAVGDTVHVWLFEGCLP